MNKEISAEHRPTDDPLTNGLSAAESMDSFSDAELMRYSRQILLVGWDLEAQSRLKQSNVLIIGAGGLGNTVAAILGRAGVGHMTVIDPDRVEDSNLQRQILFTAADISKNKAEVAAHYLQKLSPWQQIQAQAQTLADFFQQSAESFRAFDLILDCTDNFETRYLINQLAREHHIPYIMAAAQGMEGQLACFTAESACYACLFPPPEQNDEVCGSCNETGVLSSVPVVMGAMQADAALIYLGLNKMPLHNQLLLWNAVTLEQKIISFRPDPSCKICHLPDRTQQNL